MKINEKCNGLNSCKADGVCITICPVNAITISDNQPIINEDGCVDCGLCKMNCPREAIIE